VTLRSGATDPGTGASGGATLGEAGALGEAGTLLTVPFFGSGGGSGVGGVGGTTRGGAAGGTTAGGAFIAGEFLFSKSMFPNRMMHRMLPRLWASWIGSAPGGKRVETSSSAPATANSWFSRSGR
jgi:hypothetical protein